MAKATKIICLGNEAPYVLGVLGKTDRALEDIARGIKQFDAGLGVSPVVNQPGRTFLANFSSAPIADVTWVRANDEFSIVAYSLRREESTDLIERIVEGLNLSTVNSDPNFVYHLQQTRGLEVINYATLASAARLTNSDVEQMWGLPRYLQFLKYCGVSEERAVKIAKKKFPRVGFNFNL